MQAEGLDEVILDKLKMSKTKLPDLEPWKAFLSKLKNPRSTVKIGLIGKYTKLPDSYKSIIESFIHAGVVNETKVDLELINSEKITTENIESLSNLQGIVVAPGFGHRGIEGKILAIKYARENNVPFLGICLGMQCAVIEFGRNVLGLQDANSSEMDITTPHPVIDIMEHQKNISEMGGTMRLGGYACKVKKNSNAFAAYNTEKITERHRHRYEFNNNYIHDFKTAGMEATGINPNSNLVEIIEIPKHKWFVGVQFHPEYRSTVLNPHPIFIAFIKACLNN
jgi:CTP synthase